MDWFLHCGASRRCSQLLLWQLLLAVLLVVVQANPPGALHC
jgi:hypothetical protein